jgi:predicted RNA-binding protein YlxR (DUF448 family)/ribosomal protein L7Ae-like RNA K-turn-binding protein
MEARASTAGEGRRAGHVPERSCVACRRKTEARSLLRIVRAPDGALVVDWRRNLGGRGAHVCPRPACIESAIRRRGFDRALKARARYPEPGKLIGAAIRAHERQIATLVGSARSSGRLAAGTEAALREIENRKAACLLLADDAGARERFVVAARAAGVEVHPVAGKIELGAMIGRGETGVVAIADAGLAAALGRAYSRLATLGGESPRGE